MKHVGARHELDAATARPHPHAHLDVLAAPLAHLCVVRARLLPEGSPQGEEPTRHCWGRIRVGRLVRRIPVPHAAVHPSELDGLEAQAAYGSLAHAVPCLAGVPAIVRVRNGAEDRQDNRPRSLPQLLDQRLQPLLREDAVRLEEHQNGARHPLRAHDLGVRQAEPLRVGQDADLRMQGL